MRTLLCTAALAALSTAGLSTSAQAAPSPATTVDEVIVTATRLPTDLTLVTGAHVIDRAEIEARGVSFVSDLLSTVPGVGVTRTGAFGGVSAIRIRGASPDKTLVLLDGLPIGDPADPSGTFDAGSLQAADLERIEVLSGPQGSLWGSEAIGGVVAITTRAIQGWRADLEGGSFATARGFVGAGESNDAYAVSGSVAGYRTDGVSKADTGTERDGMRTFAANLAGGLQVSEGLRLDARLRYTRANIEIDGFAPPTYLLGDTPDRNASRAWQGDVRATAQAFGLSHVVSLSGYDLHRSNVSSFPSSFQAQRGVVRWTAARGEALVFGAERQESSADLSTGNSLNLSNAAVFAVGRVATGPLTVTASARHDDPEAFRAKTTGRLALAADLGRGFTAVASAGTGFKTPTISQAVCDFCFAPAVPLRPESAEGYDLRLGWSNDRISTAVTAYRLRVKDQIGYVASRYINIARTGSSGVEAEVDVRISPSQRLKLSYANLDAIDRTIGVSLLRTPDHSGSVAYFWTGNAWSGAVTVRGESSQTDTARNGFSRVRRPGFVTADASVAYDLNSRVTLTGRVENLTDERFEEGFGYREPGRAVYVGVRLRN